MNALFPTELRRASANRRSLRALEVVAASAREFSEVSGDLSALLATVARLGAEAVGDICIVQLLSDDGTVLTLGGAYHRNPEIVALVRRTYAEPNPAREGLAARILAASGPIFARQVDEEQYRRATLPRFWPLLDAVGVCSGIALPLRADGQVLGAFLLARGRGGERYTEEDLLVAEELGARAAVAIRNAKNVAALRLSEAAYRRLADSTPACVLVTDRDGTVEFANQFLLDYVGMTREELDERSWFRLIHPLDLQRITPARDAALERGDEFIGECRVRRHDGVYRWNIGRIVSVSNEHGGPGRYVRVVIDIDDRHRAADRQQMLLETSDLAAQPFDVDATFRRIVSVVVPRFADYAVAVTQREGVARLAACACADPELEPRVRDVTDAALRDLRPDFGVGRALVTGESDFYPVFEVQSEPLMSDPGLFARYQQLTARSYIVVALKWGERIFGALALFNLDPYRRFTQEDLALATELAEKTSAAIEHSRLYLEAEEANRAKDDFLGLVSHELRTPITVIMGGAEVLFARGAQLDEANKAAALQDIRTEAERLNRIIENLLTIARVEKSADDAQPVHITRELERALDAFGRQHPNRAVAFDCQADGAVVNAAELAVEHALSNYLSNADKYSPPDATIDVRAERSGAEVIVSVLDRGPGIREDETERVFEPFYRGETRPTAPGVGVGLAVCKRLIEVSGGRVWVEPRPGGGMVAAFALPVIQPDEYL